MLPSIRRTLSLLTYRLNLLRRRPQGELDSFLIEITATIFGKRDDLVSDGSFLVDKILDKTGMKGTGRWTVQEGAEHSVPVSVMTAALDARYLRYSAV